MKTRRFYESVEKDPHEVNICWKVLHLVIFALICLTSMYGAYYFQKIVDVFNSRCILFAKPSFKIVNTLNTETTTESLENNTLPLPAENSSSPTNIQAFVYKLMQLSQPTDSDEGKMVPNTNNYYVLDQEIYFVNETERRKVTIRMMHTVFSTPMMCNIVIIIPLLSLIISSALMVFIMFCGRGGRALSTDPFPGSWLYVYPVLMISFLMFLLYGMALRMVGWGFHNFCGHFVEYTGQLGCSRFMNYFTKQQKAGFRNLWQKMVCCEIAYPLGAVLWALQSILTFLRILNVADFNLRLVLISPKRHGWSEEDEEIELASHLAETPKLHNVMKIAIEERDKAKVKKI